MAYAWKIDVVTREAYLDKISTVDQMRKFIGGWIASAAPISDGGRLYVDDEGMLKPVPGWFMWKPINRPLAGNGVIVGPENLEGEPIFRDTTLEHRDVMENVRFMSNDDVLAWLATHGKEPAMTITFDGITRTVSTYNSLILSALEMTRAARENPEAV